MSDGFITSASDYTGGGADFSAPAEQETSLVFTFFKCIKKKIFLVFFVNTIIISAAAAEPQQDYQGGAGDPQAAAQGNQGENGERRGSTVWMNFVKHLIKVLDIVHTLAKSGDQTEQTGTGGFITNDPYSVNYDASGGYSQEAGKSEQDHSIASIWFFFQTFFSCWRLRSYGRRWHGSLSTTSWPLRHQIRSRTRKDFEKGWSNNKSYSQRGS